MTAESSDPPITAACRVAVPASVVHREFPNETVLLNLETGMYHGLNPVGGVIFETLREIGEIAAAVVQLARTFEQPEPVIEADVIELCAGLRERGLLTVAQPAG